MLKNYSMHLEEPPQRILHTHILGYFGMVKDNRMTHCVLATVVLILVKYTALPS